LTVEYNQIIDVAYRNHNKIVEENDRLRKQKSTWQEDAAQLKAQKERVATLEEALGPALAKARHVKSQAERIAGLESENRSKSKRIAELQAELQSRRAELQEENDARDQLGTANEERFRLEIALRDSETALRDSKAESSRKEQSLEDELGRKDQSLRDLKDELGRKDQSLRDLKDELGRKDYRYGHTRTEDARLANR
jgi:chromosome segregation ATPase